TIYTPWYDRGKFNWDYGLFVNAYIGRSGLLKASAKSSKTVHSINVEGYPMCVIMHREDKRDAEGYDLFEAGRYSESAFVLKAFTDMNPGNETAWLYLGWSLRKLHDRAGSDRAARQLLAIHPESETARELLIWNMLDAGQFEQALDMAGELYRLNPGYQPASALLAAARDSIAGKSR
ncbi:MAG: hypothetical protein WCW62_04180, partial [Bacteroidales bacterium]